MTFFRRSCLALVSVGAALISGIGTAVHAAFRATAGPPPLDLALATSTYPSPQVNGANPTDIYARSAIAGDQTDYGPGGAGRRRDASGGLFAKVRDSITGAAVFGRRAMFGSAVHGRIVDRQGFALA